MDIKTWEIEAQIDGKGIPPRCRSVKSCKNKFYVKEIESATVPNINEIAQSLIDENLVKKASQDFMTKNKAASNMSLLIWISEIRNDGGGFISKTIPLFDKTRSIRISL